MPDSTSPEHSNTDQQTAVPWRMYLSLIGAAALVLVMIGFGYISSLRMVTVYLPLIDAAMEAEVAVVSAHLWFEEIISGDANESIDTVWALLDEADDFLQVMREGGQNETHTFVPLDDAAMQAGLLAAQNQIKVFRDLAQQRLTATAGGVGSDLDQQFDAVFNGFVDEMSAVEDSLHQITQRDTSTFQVAQVVLVIVCVLAFVFIGRVLYNFDRQRAGDIDSLQSLSTDLEALAGRETAQRESLQIAVTDYMSFVQRVAGGDLTARLEMANGNQPEANDDLHQLGINLNAMVESLSSMTRQVREAVAALSSATAEIQAAATQQTASATEQDATVTQTVSTVEEVRTTVQQTSERAQAVASAATESVNTSRAGQDAVGNTVSGMELIRTQVENIAENILMLSERTQQIGEIIDTVNGLADQSKLLALNASIEAAQAGDEGKGFAVVAMEVRQLAEQSREATARVQDILSEIQGATNTAVMVTEEGSKSAEAGMTLVEQAGASIRELAATIEEAANSATQIAASTHQQTNGMEQLAAAMGQIKQATAQTAASTQQTERTIHELISMAERLEETTKRYTL